jgi:hypothetical protein
VSEAAETSRAMNIGPRLIQEFLLHAAADSRCDCFSDVDAWIRERSIFTGDDWSFFSVNPQAKSSSLNRRLTMLWAAMTHEGFVEGLHCFGFGSYVVPCGFLTALRTAIN